MSIHTISPAPGVTVLGDSKPKVRTIKSGKATIVIVTKKAA